MKLLTEDGDNRDKILSNCSKEVPNALSTWEQMHHISTMSGKGSDSDQILTVKNKEPSIFVFYKRRKLKQWPVEREDNMPTKLQPHVSTT